MDMINKAYGLAKEQLLKARLPNGQFIGRLSSSAVSTAVAALAMSLNQSDSNRLIIAVNWLINNINNDGGWGDTPESPSNLSAVMLSRAALFNAVSTLESISEQINAAILKSENWLKKNLPDSDSKTLVERILNFYGKDLTFSAPILTVSMLSNSLGKDQSLWKTIPALPFEASLIPAKFFNVLNLPVVSYAIPALIAVGIAHNTHCQPLNMITRWLRKKSVKHALRKLSKLAPDHGGFLEAAPLTGFVAFCLGKSGFRDNSTVKKGLQFLRDTMRNDGSWAIDTNLSNWLTSLSVKALGRNSKSLSNRYFMKDSDLPCIGSDDCDVLINHFRKTQFKSVNSFTGSPPGGWSWTDLPGGVPDADDTAGALVALAYLMSNSADSNVINGLKWLLGIMNRDGGIPTFCRGWGFLPFDRSCPDISAHALQAFHLWSDRVPEDLRILMNKPSNEIILFLEKSRDKDAVWAPLWFGDQDARNQQNRVYGTAVVLEALSYFPEKTVAHLVKPAIKWLCSVRNPDGGFGGEPGTPSKIETTAKAILALSLNNHEMAELEPSVNYLTNQLISANGKPKSSAIGMYFASLWYDEELYPLIFSVDALGEILQKRNRNVQI
ncbi:MAG: squalene--hopene cyclase [Candidatus Riflebacteria bacterium]|nr:squalene--hopene cyclase [Candidatus Riflebacteria bacterium]